MKEQNFIYVNVWHLKYKYKSNLKAPHKFILFYS